MTRTPARTALRAAADETPSGHLKASALMEVLGYQLAQASVLTSQVFRRSVGQPRELRPVEYTLLQLIQENPGTSPVRLAKALAVTKANITMWVDRLVARELVQRSPSASDKRAQELRATAAGEVLARQATGLLVEGEQALLHSLSRAEQAMLIELLQKVARCAER